MLDTVPINIVSRGDNQFLIADDFTRHMRKITVFAKAQAYQDRFWEFAHALYEFDLNQDWQHEWNATQEAKCQSLSEWVAANQDKLKVSPSWAMYMAGLPGLHQTIQQLVGPDESLSKEVDNLIHNTDPSRLQVVQSTVHKRLKVARAVQVQHSIDPELTPKDDVDDAIAAVIVPLQVAHEAESRKEVEAYVDETKGIVHRTIHIAVAELDQLTRSRFEISDLPRNAIVALDIWYNPQKQAEYRAEMASKPAGLPVTNGDGSDSSSEPQTV